jgi:AcrR family transcriptional regulator
MAKASIAPAERRVQQREELILAAERRIAESGASSLRARDLAHDVGVALGAIYNLVADMDELVLLVSGRTLERLDAALEAAARAAHGSGPAAELKAIAGAYLAFAREHNGLWRSVFDYRSPEGRDIPEWIAAQQARMFRHILTPLEALLPGRSPRERQLFAHTLFTATHGVVQLGLEQRLFAVPPEAIGGQLDMLVQAVCDGAARG